MNISEHSRVWIYQSNRVLTPVEEQQIQQKLDDFTAQWQAHGHQLLAKGEIRHQRFVILSVDEQQAGATGCSIDKSVKLMKELEEQFNIDLFDRFQIAYRDGEHIRSCNRQEFEDLLRSGQIHPDTTIVFNNMVATRKELHSNWEVPMKNSWHSRVFAEYI
ncbi:MAG TPA: ABC transporter ATPase [Daejeonella sp.]|nr:ABC transporter ATPase [Daejeonella sp.]